MQIPKSTRPKITGYIIAIENDTYFLLTTHQRKTKGLVKAFLQKLKINPTEEKTQRTYEKLLKCTIVATKGVKNNLFYIVRTDATNKNAKIYAENELKIIEVR